MGEPRELHVRTVRWRGHETTAKRPDGSGDDSEANRTGAERGVDHSMTTDTPDEYVWMLHARCRGANPTEFFPSDGTGVEFAQRICSGCPVRRECLEYALLHRIEHGVWGGASERERRRILRRRRDMAVSADASGDLRASEPMSEPAQVMEPVTTELRETPTT
jgi:WhiB family transcriptional regulator, redox-sensing transcriptional regulator